MKLLIFIFNVASLIVDTVGWAFARIIKLLLHGVTSFCGWGIDKIQSLPENIQIPIGTTLAIILLGIFLACIWMFPHIVIFTLIVVPVSLFLLKLCIGWVALFSLIYAIYLGIKACSIRFLHYISPNKI